MSNIVTQMMGIEDDNQEIMGPILQMLKKLKIKLISKGEVVFKKDEIATEMYFIIEGKVVVFIDKDDNKG